MANDLSIPSGFLSQMYADARMTVKVPFACMSKIISTLRVVFFIAMTLTAKANTSIETLINSNVMNAFKSPLPEIKLSYKAGTYQKVKILSSADAANLFRKIFDSDLLEYREEFILLLLNHSSNTIGFIKLSSGGLTGTVADSRMIFSTALLAGATRIIVSHNHPSGTLKPSQQDTTLTKKLKQVGELIEIALLDHIIITAESYYSFADAGQI